ncbi:hypothetical protein MUN82_14015 [Hymenobacter aerilatus]|uniref:Uncharacterized protein n=1 Tax=Hymenobacter aerilatus TaxID=2932251 RepID=A0A8T9SQP4_9BACT|nr:hypothetical protein [Hymenobacter aerilatus]UOR04057.1 hypothetical protein MUN82_14015 [Hymenobacter aerilatus]
MSYDLLVFSKEAAPKTRTEFMGWYDAQTEWKEEHIYSDPAITTHELRAWLMEMEQTFPDMNGPNTTDGHKSDYETDYSIGRVVIYAAFSWSLAKEAHETAHRLARKYQVGFYDPSFEGPILLPENGDLGLIEEVDQQNPGLKKPWWKLR